jgi:hypothetical protein
MQHLSHDMRDELDARVRAIDWTDAACEYDSPERHLVASWAAQSDLVPSALGRLFPDDQQRERMIEYTMVRVVEKILGVAIESKSAQWNWGNLWDPREDTSFCGWCRRLAYSVARTNAGRVLHPKTVNGSGMENDDGYNPAWDSKDSKPLMTVAPDELFAEHPDLAVPRPVGGSRERMDALLRLNGPARTLRWLRRCGYWDASMDGLDPDVALALLSAPVPRARAMQLPLLFAGRERMAELYARTQTAKPDQRHLGELRREVTAAARENGEREWHVWTRLGTAAAQLASV